jgi:RHS repeat-associated protein
LDAKRGYAGHEEDAITGLVYAEARYYNPATGRFNSQDPLFLDIGTDLSKYDKGLPELLSDPQNLNSYSYVRNNPLKYIDPTGEDYYHFNSGKITNKRMSTD